jgi:hypothetical protein
MHVSTVAEASSEAFFFFFFGTVCELPSRCTVGVEVVLTLPFSLAIVCPTVCMVHRASEQVQQRATVSYSSRIELQEVRRLHNVQSQRCSKHTLHSATSQEAQQRTAVSLSTLSSCSASAQNYVTFIHSAAVT